MPHIIYIDEAQLNREFEQMMDDHALSDRSTSIPHYHEHDPGYNPNLLPAGSSRPNGMPAGWNQEGRAYQSFGGGSVSSGCVWAALLIGALVAIAIIAAGVL